VIGWRASGQCAGLRPWSVWGRMPVAGTETEVLASWTGRLGCGCGSGTWWSWRSRRVARRDTRCRLVDTGTSFADILRCYRKPTKTTLAKILVRQRSTRYSFDGHATKWL